MVLVVVTSCCPQQSATPKLIIQSASPDRALGCDRWWREEIAAALCPCIVTSTAYQVQGNSTALLLLSLLVRACAGWPLALSPQYFNAGNWYANDIPIRRGFRWLAAICIYCSFADTLHSQALFWRRNETYPDQSVTLVLMIRAKFIVHVSSNTNSKLSVTSFIYWPACAENEVLLQSRST